MHGALQGLRQACSIAHEAHTDACFVQSIHIGFDGALGQLQQECNLVAISEPVF